jgi:two-component system sensor histidine kinase/response regulator
MKTSDEQDDQPDFDPRLLNGMRLAARFAQGLVIAVAVLVLLGWALNIEVLRSVIPGLTAMNPGGTALACLLSSGSLWLLTAPDRSPRATRVAQGMALAVIAFAALRVVLYFVGLEWGPDQWLFRARLDLYHPPNRMAPNTALGLLLIGGALLTIDVETRRGLRPAQWLALAAAFLSLFTLVGYAYNAAILIGIRAYIPMALNSAATLALLAIGVLLIRPDRGIMAVVSHPETGGEMARRLLPASILAPAAFAWLASAGQWAGLFDPSFGISLFVVSTIVLFTTLIWWNASSLNRVDVERSRTQKELRRKGAILTSVLNSMGDGVVVADRSGQFLIFNPVAERILGLGATDAAPSEWTDQYGLFSPETGKPLQVEEIPLVRAIRGESTDQVDLLIKNPRLPDNVNISVTGRPLKGDEGIEGGVVVFQDTTQRRRADEALRRARDEADSANRAKSEFLANMSHEIRTPMNAVIGMTELVLETELDEMQRTYLKIVNDSAESLLSLINDILDFSKIEAGKLELDHAPFQLRDLLGDAMKTLAVRARGKDLELACHIAPEVPDCLIGDPHRLRQVVTNLVGNALKFTERGEVVLKVTADEVTDDQVRLHVAVRDTGIGIPQDKLHLLFAAFSQVDASTTRRYGGTGLGLAITARLVPLMNGETWVESDPGQGSTFHFTATFDRDRSPPPPPAALESLRNLRVLIVDDNATNRLILHETLTAWGMRPVSLAAAGDALRELERAAETHDPFRILLSDVQMPDVDGFELTSRIQQDRRFGGTVILMLSSGAGPGDVARCREQGAAAYLMKPIKSSELLASIAAAIGAATTGEQPRSGDADSSRPLRILLAEDSPANQQLALGVLRKWGHTLQIANNGVEAIAAFEAGTFDVILMDVQMPGMDGFQATVRIREIEQRQGGHTPIIAMTAHAMKGDRENCVLAGMDDYVAKPIRWPELRKALDRTVPKVATPAVPQDQVQNAPTQKRSDGDDVTPEAPTLPANEPAWTLDWAEAIHAVDGDTKLLREVLQELLIEWPTRLSDMQTSAAADNIPTLRRSVHSIRGSLRIFGPTAAVDLAEQIETLIKDDQTPSAIALMPAFEAQVRSVLEEISRRLNSHEL